MKKGDKIYIALTDRVELCEVTYISNLDSNVVYVKDSDGADFPVFITEVFNNEEEALLRTISNLSDKIVDCNDNIKFFKNKLTKCEDTLARIKTKLDAINSNK